MYLKIDILDYQERVTQKSLRFGVDSNSKYQSNQHSQSSLHTKHSKEKSRNGSMASDAFDMPQQHANKKCQNKKKKEINRIKLLFHQQIILCMKEIHC